MPGGNGFSNQFTLPNVPRQLAVISGGSGGGNTSNVTFTNNVITGTSGGTNASGDPQGNTLVTIDSNGATITGNQFMGTTSRFATSLRARGPNTTINGNTSVPQSQRVRQFREELQDVSLLDNRGYISIPFPTTDEMLRLSPLTRNHKLQFVEVEVVGTSVGDTIGRIYLRQRGTGVVRTVDDESLRFAFPEVTGVIDAFFNGSRVFNPEIYRSLRFADRPLINSAWEVVINTRDEVANSDIDLDSLTDIRLYFYYTDFTAF